MNPQKIIDMLCSADEQMFELGVVLALNMGPEWMKEWLPGTDNRNYITTKFMPSQGRIYIKGSIAIIISYTRIKWWYSYQIPAEVYNFYKIIRL